MKKAVMEWSLLVQVSFSPGSSRVFDAKLHSHTYLLVQTPS